MRARLARVRRAGRALARASVPLLVVIVSTAFPATAGATAASTKGSRADAGHHAPASLAEAGKVRFWECPAKTTELLVAVSTLTLHPGATLGVSFTVKNEGSSSCNYTAPYASTEPGPTTTALQAGPCGSIGFEVLGPRHHEVWPGTQVVNCPALGFAQLAPGATVSGTGTWNQTQSDGTSPVRPGNYTLVVMNAHFSFPIDVDT